jgi:carbamoyl-phosphate synthase large subunit
LREVFDEYEIECVINLAKSRGTGSTDEDYVARRFVLVSTVYGLFIVESFSRNAVDFGLPLLNNARCAKLFVESLALKIPQGGLKRYVEGNIPSEVKSWREFVGSRA